MGSGRRAEVIAAALMITSTRYSSAKAIPICRYTHIAPAMVRTVTRRWLLMRRRMITGVTKSSTASDR